MIWILFIYVAAFIFSPVNLLSKTLSRKKRTDEFIPCDEGWFLFREKCLKLHGTKREILGTTWERADAYCRNDRGHLVTIQSKEEHDFIVSFMLLDASHKVWIGLSDRVNSTNFTWSDGSAVNFTYWVEGQPKRYTGGGCVLMLFYPPTNTIGEWSNFKCHSWNAYICQRRINLRKKSQNPQFCTAEQGGGWKFQNTCYQVVMEMKTWDSAEQHCMDRYDGHLATVLDRGVDLFLDYILSRIKTPVWIGMKLTDELQQKWSSGWFVAYNRTVTHYLSVLYDPCVLRDNSSIWNTAPCLKNYPFICDTFRDPPVLKRPLSGSHCPEIPGDWKDLGGEYCYFFEIEKRVIWYDANYECERRGGTLASIHSKEETELILPFVKYANAVGFWIGLLRLLGREDVFLWTDGSPVDYTHWIRGQPTYETEKKCVHVWASFGAYILEWDNTDCLSNFGYICSVRKVAPNITVALETSECTSYPVSYNILIGISVCIHLVLISLGVMVYCLRSRRTKRQKASNASDLPQVEFKTYHRQNRSQIEEEDEGEDLQNEETYYETMY